MSSLPDGVCDVNKGVDTAVVHRFPPKNNILQQTVLQNNHTSKHYKATSMFFCGKPEHAGFREVPQGAASVVLQVHRVNVLCGSRLSIRDKKQRQINNKEQKNKENVFKRFSIHRSEVKLASIVDPRTKLQVTRLLLDWTMIVQ